MTRELIEKRIGACGCPEEVWRIDGLDVEIHFENAPEGPFADVWVDAGDWDVLNRYSGEPDVAREAALADIESWPDEPLRDPQQERKHMLKKIAKAIILLAALAIILPLEAAQLGLWPF